MDVVWLIVFAPLVLCCHNLRMKKFTASSTLACTINILRSDLMLLESSVSDAAIWNINLESPIKIQMEPFKLSYDIYGTGINYTDCQLIANDNCNMFIVQASGHILP